MKAAFNSGANKVTQASLCAGLSSRRSRHSLAAMAVLLDLNETLIQTSFLKPLRRSGKWQETHLFFDRTSLPPGTRDFVAELKELGSVGIVTSAPRAYAEEILAYHRLELDVLVAGDEVQNPKPHPEGLIKAAALLGLRTDQCVYIGDHEFDVMAAIRACATPLTISWKLPDTPAESAFHSWPELRAKLFRTNLAAYRPAGY